MLPLIGLAVFLLLRAPLVFADSSQALNDAVKAGNVETFDALIQGGADICAKDKYSFTPRLWAIGHGSAAMLQHVLDSGGGKCPQDAPGLFEAAKNAKAANVPLLCAAGENANTKDGTGVSPLLYAATLGSIETVQALLNCKPKADVNATDKNGATALIRSALACQTKMVSFLVANSAALNVQDRSGYTALLWAAHNGCSAATQALLDAHADPDLRGKDGVCASDSAAKRGYPDIAAMFTLKK